MTLHRYTPYYKPLTMLGVPIVVGQLGTIVLAFADTLMIGHHATSELAAAAFVNNIINLVIIFALGFSYAVTPTVGTLYGQEKTQRIGEMVRNAICANLLLAALIVGVMGGFYLSIDHLGQPAELLPLIKPYYLVLLASLPFVCLFNVFKQFADGITDTALSMWVLIGGNILNIFGNWVLIYGNLGAPRLEVQGAAIATIIARLTEMTMFLIFIAVKRPPFSATPKELVSVDFPLFFRMLKKGSMVLGSEMLWVISETVTTALYNGRGGADVVSGMAASFAIANLFFVAFSGITTATGVILGSTLGSGELDKARQEKRWLMTAGVVFGFFMIFVGLLTVPLIPVVFGHLSASAQSITRRMIVLMSLFMPPWVYINVQLAVSRAGGDTAMGLWVDATTTLLMIIPGIFLVARYTTIGPVAMYGMVKAVDFVKITIAHFMLKRERWVRNLTDIVQPVKTTE